MIIFDSARIAQHKKRASAAPELFLLREMLAEIAGRLSDIKRSFPQAIALGTQGLMAEAAPDIRWFYHEEGEALPFSEESVDLVVSANLHWVNDVPGVLSQIKRILKPDGLFLAILPGGETLTELRQSFEAAELAHSGGISPRVSPFIDIRDGGALLQRAGFALPVADSFKLMLEYENAFSLMQDLRGMGETNALTESRKHFTSRTLMAGMAAYYAAHFSGEDGRIPATIELLVLTGWRPHASQQQPARRGSGQVSLRVLGDETGD